MYHVVKNDVRIQHFILVMDTVTILQHNILAIGILKISALLRKRPVNIIMTLIFIALGLLLTTLTFNSIAFIGEVSQPKLLNILLLKINLVKIKLEKKKKV